MKITILSGLALLGFVSAFGSGCGHSSSPPKNTQIITSPRVIVAQSSRALPPVSHQTLPAFSQTDGDHIGETLQSSTRQIVKMCESGVSEGVIRSYAENAAEPFYLNADQIIYLTDIGVSDDILQSMLKHDQALGEAIPEIEEGEDAPIAERIVYEESLYEPSSLPSQNISVRQTSTQTIVVKEKPFVSTQVFYDALSPYGTWIYLDNYGWTWQPTAATLNIQWRPYYDNGSWAYTDAGWYWNSGYSWGWAPFHYGRWTRQVGYGWLWVPGNRWAPSWVSWRYSDAYCGWAPLPPYADYRVGVGFTFRGSRVGVGFGFGLGYNHFNFVSRRHFGRRPHHRHNDRIVADQTQQSIYNNSTIINNYIVGDDNIVINKGIGRERLHRGEKEIRQVALRDVSGSARVRDRGRKDEKEAISVYRPRIKSARSQPTERQLAHQETRPTRRRIEDRSGKSLRSQPSQNRNSSRHLTARTSFSSPHNRSNLSREKKNVRSYIPSRSRSIVNHHQEINRSSSNSISRSSLPRSRSSFSNSSNSILPRSRSSYSNSSNSNSSFSRSRSPSNSILSSQKRFAPQPKQRTVPNYHRGNLPSTSRKQSVSRTSQTYRTPQISRSSNSNSRSSFSNSSLSRSRSSNSNSSNSNSSNSILPRSRSSQTSQISRSSRSSKSTIQSPSYRQKSSVSSRSMPRSRHSSTRSVPSRSSHEKAKSTSRSPSRKR